MNLAEAIYQHSCRLPEQAAREALDFIEFLEQRYGVRPASESEMRPGDLALNMFGKEGGVELELPARLPHQPPEL